MSVPATTSLRPREPQKQSAKKSDPVVLVVLSPSNRHPLLTELQFVNAEVRTTEDLSSAREQLRADPDIDVVITDLTLPDGNWCDIFKYLVDEGIRANVVVNAPFADERLWSEILWRGAYDLLVEPYENFELKRVLEGAARAASPFAHEDTGRGVNAA